MIKGLQEGSFYEGFIGVIKPRLRANGIFQVFIEALYISWRRWARLLLHCLRNNVQYKTG